MPHRGMDARLLERGNTATPLLKRAWEADKRTDQWTLLCHTGEMEPMGQSMPPRMPSACLQKSRSLLGRSSSCVTHLNNLVHDHASAMLSFLCNGTGGAWPSLHLSETTILHAVRIGLVPLHHQRGEHHLVTFTAQAPVIVCMLKRERLDIPSDVLHQLQLTQQQSLPVPLAPPDQPGREVVPEVHAHAEHTDMPTVPAMAVPPTTIAAAEMQEEATLDPRAQTILAYLFSQPQPLGLDWKTSIQLALHLPDPPKMKGHAAYKALQQAYPLLERLHEGTLPHPSASLLEFYRTYFLEQQRWGDFKDIMNDWGIA